MTKTLAVTKDRERAFALAEIAARELNHPYEVWCHDGDLGHPEGDIVGTRDYCVIRAAWSEAYLPRGWVFHGVAHAAVGSPA